MQSSAVDFLSFPPIIRDLEIGAYEHLWLDERNMSFKRMADIFRDQPDRLPSQLVLSDIAQKVASNFFEEVNKVDLPSPVRANIYGEYDYPKYLRDANDPVPLLYFLGTWDLVYHPKRISIIGTRNPSPEGIKRAKRLTRELVNHKYLIVSGLADGIDTVAHETALAVGGQTIAVIGTSITTHYPKKNIELRDKIAKEHLVVSQVPVLRYAKQDWRVNRGFFPERNKTMSALSQATVIVEAGETSGTRIQAKAAIDQGRKLFILDSCFKRSDITWPEKYTKKGAIRVKDTEDILRELE